MGRIRPGVWVSVSFPTAAKRVLRPGSGCPGAGLVSYRAWHAGPCLTVAISGVGGQLMVAVDTEIV